MYLSSQASLIRVSEVRQINLIRLILQRHLMFFRWCLYALLPQAHRLR